METKQQSIHIVLCDPHTIFRIGLASLLTRENRVTVNDHPSRASEALDSITRGPVDLAIVDYDLPDMDGVETLLRMKDRVRGLKTILLSSRENLELRETVMRKGIDAFILKFSNPDRIMEGIHTVMDGRSYFSEEGDRNPGQNSLTPRENPLSKLTRKEREIMRCLAQGLTYKETGVELGITVKTVEFHRGNLTRKLGKKSIADITRLSLAWGLIEQDSPVAQISSSPV